MSSADPTFIAFLVGAIGAIALFAAYLVKDTIADSRKQRDIAMAGWQSQTQATEKLAGALRDQNMLNERMLKARD